MARRPNLLLITTDQQRGDALGINGNAILRTPNLDAMAAAGINCPRAYSTCPVCIPARRSILTGLHPVSHGLRRYEDGLQWEPPFTLPGLLGDAGYQTQLIGKLHLHPQRKRYGFDHQVLSEAPSVRPTSPLQPVNDYGSWLRGRGIEFHPNSQGISDNSRVARPWNLGEEYHHSSWLAEEAVRFLCDQRDPTAPWFLHLSFLHPHPPLLPPQFYWDRYAGRADLSPCIGEWAAPVAARGPGVHPDHPVGPFPEAEIRDAIAGYYALINHIDDRIAYVFQRYLEYGNARAEEPIWIIFASDHGEMLGDHHLYRKALPYEASARVPFFLAGLNVDCRSGVCDDLVSLEDIAPTFLDLAGLEIPAAMDGRSLAPCVRGETPRRREVLYGECGNRFAHHYVVRGSEKYIWYAKTNEEQLFDVVADPGERRDLSGDAARLEPFRRLLAEHLKGRDDYDYDPARCAPCGNKPPRVFWGA